MAHYQRRGQFATGTPVPHPHAEHVGVLQGGPLGQDGPQEGQGEEQADEVQEQGKQEGEVTVADDPAPPRHPLRRQWIRRT